MKTKTLIGLIFLSSVYLFSQEKINYHKIMLFKDVYPVKKSGSLLNKQIADNKHSPVNKEYSENAILYLPLKEIHFSKDYALNTLAFSDSTEFMYYTTSPNKGKIMQEVTYNEYGNVNKTFYKYNNFGYIECTKYFYWDGLNWYVWKRDTLTYSGSQPVKVEYQMYNSTANTFTTTQKIENTYNFSGKLVKRVFYDSDYDMNTGNYDFKISCQSNIYYNTVGQYTAVVIDDYDTYTQTKMYSYKEQYYYDNSGKINKAYGFEWNNNTNKWDTSCKIYNIVWYKWVSNKIEDICNNLLASADIIYYYYDVNPPLPPDKSKIQRVYDPIDDELIDDTELYWDYDSNSWFVYEYKYLLTRNPSYGNMITEKLEQYYETGYSDFELLHKWIYKQPSLTSVYFSNTIKEPITIYPNPNNGNFVVNLNNHYTDVQLEISDVTGKTIIRQKIVPDNNLLKINVTNLPKGVYFVQVYSGNSKIDNPLKILVQ